MGITNHELHDKDFYAWTKKTAQLLKDGKISEVDVMNLSEELEELGMGNKRAVISQLSRLIAHLLKWKYQSGLRGTSWKTSINGARLEISYFFEDSKLLKKEAEENFTKAYKLGIQWASSETGIEVKNFPKECPFTLEQCLDENFLPE
jgi:Domain of unknown function DUF29